MATIKTVDQVSVARDTVASAVASQTAPFVLIGNSISNPGQRIQRSFPNVQAAQQWLATQGHDMNIEYALPMGTFVS